MEIGTNTKTLAMDEPVVKNKKDKTILSKLKRNSYMNESTLLTEEGEHTKRAKGIIQRMRDSDKKKNVEREKEKAKMKIDRKTKEAQLLSKAKIDDYKGLKNKT